MLSMVDMIDLYTNLQAFRPQFKKMEMAMSIYATYYNQLSQAFEPFLEPWSLTIQINQKSENHSEDIKIFSPDFLNINVTYGMGLNILQVQQKITEKVKFIDKILFEDKNKKEDYASKPKPRDDRLKSAVVTKEDKLI